MLFYLLNSNTEKILISKKLNDFLNHDLILEISIPEKTILEFKQWLKDNTQHSIHF